MGTITWDTLADGPNTNGAKLEGSMKSRALSSYERVIDFETRLTVPEGEELKDGAIYSTFIQVKRPWDRVYESFVCAVKVVSAGTNTVFNYSTCSPELFSDLAMAATGNFKVY